MRKIFSPVEYKYLIDVFKFIKIKAANITHSRKSWKSKTKCKSKIKCFQINKLMFIYIILKKVTKIDAETCVEKSALQTIKCVFRSNTEYKHIMS